MKKQKKKGVKREQTVRWAAAALRPSTCDRERNILLQVFKDCPYTCDLWGPGIFCRKKIEAKIISKQKHTFSLTYFGFILYAKPKHSDFIIWFWLETFAHQRQTWLSDFLFAFRLRNKSTTNSGDECRWFSLNLILTFLASELQMIQLHFGSWQWATDTFLLFSWKLGRNMLFSRRTACWFLSLNTDFIIRIFVSSPCVVIVSLIKCINMDQ